MREVIYKDMALFDRLILRFLAENKVRSRVHRIDLHSLLVAGIALIIGIKERNVKV
jgi:thermostable 8-oxoguanine DNA glycosylase